MTEYDASQLDLSRAIAHNLWDGWKETPIVMTVNAYRGVTQLEVRETWQSNNQLMRTQKGLNIPIEFVPELVAEMLKLYNETEKMNLQVMEVADE